MNTEKADRYSNFELLRIISMFMIIAFHYCLHGNNNHIFQSTFSINYIIATVFGSWGLLGVDCFVFISAYFLTNTIKFSTKKLLRLIIQTITYSIFITIILYKLGYIDISFKQLVKSFLSPFIGDYWFITAYCMLYLIYPFLNKMINYINKKTLFKLLILMSILVPAYSTVFLVNYSPLGDYVFLVYLYLIMGYLKKESGNWFEIYAKSGFIITTIFIIIFQICMSIFGSVFRIQFLLIHANILILRYSPLMVLDAVFLFYIFKNLRNFKSKIINTIAGTTLGIYLFHENGIFGTVLWDKILHIDKIYYGNSFLLAMILTVIMLFSIGAILDIFRFAIIEKPLFSIKVADRYLSKIDEWINDIQN